MVAVLSLIPLRPHVLASGKVEHIAAYALTSLAFIGGYWSNQKFRRNITLVLGLIVYAGLLEFLQHWSPGRTPAWLDFLASSTGVVIGAIAVLVWQKISPR